jgi:hypothetical protein
VPPEKGHRKNCTFGSCLGGGSRLAPPPHFGHPTHCKQPVEWVGRWKFLNGWTKVCSCEQHADELVGARRLAALIRKTFRWLGSNSPGYHAGERIADSVWQRPGRDFPSARFLRV